MEKAEGAFDYDEFEEAATERWFRLEILFMCKKHDTGFNRDGIKEATDPYWKCYNEFITGL